MGGSRFGSTFWAYQLARDTARRLGDSEAERYCTQMMRSPDALIWQLPVLGEHHPVLRKYFPAYFEWCEHSGYDAYWAERDWLPKVKERPVPSLQIGDGTTFSSWARCKATKRCSRNREARSSFIV